MITLAPVVSRVWITLDLMSASFSQKLFPTVLAKFSNPFTLLFCQDLEVAN
jgi:hypothetical protein